MAGRTAPVVGGLAGLFVVGIFYADGFRDVQLMAVLGFVWFAAGWLVVRNRRTFRRMESRWNVLFVLLTVGVAWFGVHAEIPLPENYRTALMMLVLGVGWAGAGVGIEATRSAGSHASEAAAPAD